MTQAEFENLKGGDVCVIKKGPNGGKKGMVICTESGLILLKAMGTKFSSRFGDLRFRFCKPENVDIT